jgi:AraC family transcriptional regulator
MQSQAWSETPAQGRRLRGVVRPSVEDERSWRRIADPHDKSVGPVLAVGRWKQWTPHPHQLTAIALSEHYTVDVLLDETSVDCFKDGHRIATGKVGFGATQITAPGQEVQCDFSWSSEAIHVFIPHAVLVATYEDVTQRSCPAGLALRDSCFAVDETIGKLAHALADTSMLQGSCATLYSEHLSMALLTRLMARQGNMDGDDSKRGGLAHWRQRRAVDYMEANLGQQISLQEIAEHAGLSRMHFAAQFKMATGVTPHAFLLYRRIDKAKWLLRKPELTLVQIASEVGFQSQSHFTTVFRRFSGTTPARWRAQCDGLSVDDETEATHRATRPASALHSRSGDSMDTQNST